MSKKKAANKGKKTAGADDGEDWESILQEFKPNPPATTTANAEPQAPAAPAKESESAPTESTNGAEEDEEGSDDEDDKAGAGGAKKDKRKKKKKPAKKEEKKPVVQSAAAKAALLHQQRVAEEEARLKKLREEEEERIRLEEEARLAEERRIAEEKERKRRAKQEKVEAQKAAGTYMTKTEKERLKKQQEKLEAMRKAGLIQVPAVGAGGEAAATSAAGAAALYGRKKKPNQQANSKQQEVVQEEEDDEDSDNDEEDEGGVKNNTNKAEEEEEEEDDWEKIARDEEAPASPSKAAAEEEDEDDWKSSSAPTALAKQVNSKLDLTAKKAAVYLATLEDTLELEAKAQQEVLRAQGLERKKREDEARRKREEEEQQRQEVERHELDKVRRREGCHRRRKLAETEAKSRRTGEKLRAPISCIMGHVDTGKTKLLDKIRHSSVQEGEAGGITQQIGATHFPRETLVTQTAAYTQAVNPAFAIRVPGLLMIDTPGHEAFTNLRNRGSSLCDIAILVVDLMHGLEPQTIESITLLKKHRTPFLVALNKVDRCYNWQSEPNSSIRASLARQDDNVRSEFDTKARHCMTQLMQQGLNVAYYWENDDLQHTVSIVPTSAITGEGIPDLLAMLLTLSQDLLTDALMYHESVECTVLEVKAIEGLSTSVDVVLVNGSLSEGDTIVVSTMDGPVVTTIRALLTPPPNREMRVGHQFVHHAKISGAVGVKIVAPDIARTIAGTSLLVCHAEDDVEAVKEELLGESGGDIAGFLKGLATESKGVMVHASTLGALEALLAYLREECKPAIPVTYVNIGPIHKKDVFRASIMHEKTLPEYATILAFDVGIDAEARDLAEESNVKIFFADIIYHLFDQFSAYMRQFYETRKEKASQSVVFPCVLKILGTAYRNKDPIVLGVEVLEGTLRLNTPLYIPQISLDVGKVASLEVNHKEVPVAKKGTQVAVRIVNESNPTLTFGRQFDEHHALYSKVSRESIDACKEFFKEDLTKDDWNLIVKLKKVFDIK